MAKERETRHEMKHGETKDMHHKAEGGHPEHRASEFTGKGKGHHTDCPDAE